MVIISGQVCLVLAKLQEEAGGCAQATWPGASGGLQSFRTPCLSLVLGSRQMPLSSSQFLTAMGREAASLSELKWGSCGQGPCFPEVRGPQEI
jgi:hypothetical protein